MDKHISINHILMFIGCFLIGVALFLALTIWFCRNAKKKKKEAKTNEANRKEAAVDESGGLTNPPSSVAMEERKGMTSSKPETSAALPSQSQVALASPEVNEIKFEELLKAPAECLGRGKHGSLYKVICENHRMTLTVKRIKDWEITGLDFKNRMQRLSRLNHPNVMRPVAFYSSSLEKLVVYEYQQNGSLLGLLQGKALDWSSRLSVASRTAEALAFMHRELKEDRIPHGNFKSSNIMFNNNMEACISEYGLKPAEAIPEGENVVGGFRADVYGLGVILMELLTGKMVENNGQEDLASWVVAVLREEWTVEVFDRALIQEGASEGRMVSLLQVAVKCVKGSPEARPSTNQVSAMICSIKEEEERSMDVSLSTT